MHRNCKRCCKILNTASYLKHGSAKKAKRRRKKSAAKSHHQQRRRAEALGTEVDGSISIHVLYERDDGICGICCKAVKGIDASIDHKVALINGGTHTWDNVQLAHLKCNLQKGAN